MKDADPKSSDFYDLFSYGGAQAAKFTRAAKSMVARPATVLLIDDAGATWVDYAAERVIDEAPPSGLTSFAEIAPVVVR